MALEDVHRARNTQSVLQQDPRHRPLKLLRITVPEPKELVGGSKVATGIRAGRLGFESQHVDCMPDGRPQAAVRVRAPEPDDHHPLNLLDVGVETAAAQPRVSSVEDRSLAIQVPHPPHQVDDISISYDQSRSSTTCDLEKDDPKAIDVRLNACPAGKHALRVNVPHRASYACGV